MANQVNEIIGKAKNNPLGLILGAGAGFLVAKKVVKTEKLLMVIASSLVGAIAGVLVQSKIKAKKSQPTNATVTK